MRPDFANAHYNLGNVLLDLWRPEDAEASFRRSLLLRPQNFKAHHNLGYLYHRLGRLDEAEGVFRAALQLYPDDPGLHASLGHTLLLAGKFEEGWKENEWQSKTKQSVPAPKRFFVPSWNGEAIANRIILLHPGEGGHGDTLQFCRYVPQIAACAKTVLEVQPSLVRLLSQLTSVSEIVVHGDRLPPYDLHCSLMSLPQVLGTTLDTIPATTPYLLPDPADTTHWRKRLAGVTGLRVGICWAGGGEVYSPRKSALDLRRSMSLETLAPLGKIAGVCFVSLQKGPPAVEATRPPLGMNFNDFTTEIHDFADTAALIDSLDLVISVDTSVAHLAGALGKPVWLLNRFDTCWRWLHNRDDSPWYPSLRQFRQPVPGDWDSVIGLVRDALQRFTQTRSSD